jgi:hypothetical protein
MAGQWFSPCTPISSNNTADCHDIFKKEKILWLQYCIPHFSCCEKKPNKKPKNSTWPTSADRKVKLHLHAKTGFSIRYHPKTKYASKFQHNKKKKIHKIHLHATSNFNLIFHSQDIVWQQKIQYILCSKRDITPSRIIIKSKKSSLLNLTYIFIKTHLHTHTSDFSFTIYHLETKNLANLK